MHSPGPSEHCANEVNFTRVLQNKNGMDTSIEGVEIPKELNKNYSEVPHIVFLVKGDSVQVNTIERKWKECYNHCYNTRDPFYVLNDASAHLKHRKV